MNAVIRRETAARFRALSTWIFLAVALFFGGALCALFQLLMEDVHFSYPLEYLQIVMIVALPLLTMGAFAAPGEREARRLVLSLGVTAWQTVLGKYLSYLAALGALCAVLALYPLVVSAFGTIAMATTYATLLAFFLLCAALLALCLWIAALLRTRGRALTAVLGVVALVVVYLPEVVSLLLDSVGAPAGPVTLLRAVSLSTRLLRFGNGIFDVGTVVFDLSVIAFFLCLAWVSEVRARHREEVCGL